MIHDDLPLAILSDIYYYCHNNYNIISPVPNYLTYYGDLFYFYFFESSGMMVLLPPDRPLQFILAWLFVGHRCRCALQHYFRPHFSLFSRKPLKPGTVPMRVTSVSEFQSVRRQSCMTKVFRRLQKVWGDRITIQSAKTCCIRCKSHHPIIARARYSLLRKKSFVIIHNQHHAIPDDRYINPWKYCMNYDCFSSLWRVVVAGFFRSIAVYFYNIFCRL